MQAAGDGDGSDDMEVMMMMGEGEIVEDGVIACLATTWTTLPPSAYHHLVRAESCLAVPSGLGGIID